MVTNTKLVQSLNVLSPIDVTPEGIVMDFNNSHPSNALAPIDVTDDGIVIE